MRPFRTLWRENRLLLLALAGALAVTLFFAAGAVRHAISFRDLPPDQPIAGWMTPGYVGHSWHVPREVIGGVLGVAPGTFPRGATLDEIAESRGEPTAALIAEFETAIAASRAEAPK